jgi:hypothetical protein
MKKDTEVLFFCLQLPIGKRFKDKILEKDKNL